MLSIYISKFDKSTDYNPLFKKLSLENDSYGDIIHTTHVINFKYRSSKPIIILINGFELIAFKGGAAFVAFFKNGNLNESSDQGITELNWLKEKLESIIKEIDEKLLSQISLENKANLFLHWGGPGRKAASDRLKKAAELTVFPYQIIDFSTQDPDEYKKLKNGNLDDIQEAEKSLIAKSKEFNRKIYELMEMILIKNADKYLKSLKQDKVEPFIVKNMDLYEEAYWLLEEFSEKLQELTFDNEEKKKQAMEFYTDKDKFGSVIRLLKEPEIQILDIKKFRTVMNEFLALLPHEIYAKES